MSQVTRVINGVEFTVGDFEYTDYGDYTGKGPVTSLTERKHRRGRFQFTCRCPAYPFPHREGSGQCGHRRDAWEAWAAERGF